jgi:hypothetical protein
MKWNYTDDGDEPSFRQPEWDEPIHNPSPWVLALAFGAVILITFGVLEFAEWIAR